MTAPTDKTTFRQVLANREFSAVLVAWLISILGTVITHVALAVLVFERTGSALLSALAFSAGWLPHLLIGTLLSGMVDRVRPRRLLVGCEVVSAIIIGIMALPGLPVAALFALLLLLGCITPVFMTTRAATLPALLPGDTYVLGRSMLNVVAHGGQLVGYAVGGVLVAAVSPQGALAVDAASFLISALVLRLGMLDRSPVRPAISGGLARDSLAGLRQLWGLPLVRALLLLGWVPMLFVVVPEAVAVPYADEIGAGSTGAGVLLASVAGGVLVSTMAVARLLQPKTRLRAMGPMALAMFIPLLFFITTPPLPVAAGLLILLGLGAGYSVAQSQALLAALPMPLRGRGLAVASSGSMLFQALGFTAGGAMADLLAPADVVVLGSITGLLATGLVLRAVRRHSGGDRLGDSGRSRQASPAR